MILCIRTNGPISQIVLKPFYKNIYNAQGFNIYMYKELFRQAFLLFWKDLLINCGACLGLCFCNNITQSDNNSIQTSIGQKFRWFDGKKLSRTIGNVSHSSLSLLNYFNLSIYYLVKMVHSTSNLHMVQINKISPKSHVDLMI